MSVSDWFSTFCDTLKVQNSAAISTRYHAITSRLNQDFWSTYSNTARSLYVGSYGRNTAIEGFSDVDMTFELPFATYQRYSAYLGNGQSALLQEVRQSVAKTYSTTSVRADGQVISIPFLDGITFELVPVFVNQDSSYTFPDANNGGAWKTTNPRPEIKAIRDRNNECNKNLVPLCRMMRAWRAKWNVPISGLLIDTLAYQFIANWEYRDKSFLYYDFMCRDFFSFMADQSRTQEYWSAPGSGQRVYGKDLFQAKAQRCYNLAVVAIDNETSTPKYEWTAKQKWREIFGSKFPD